MNKVVELINNNDCDFIGEVELHIIGEAERNLNIKFSQEVKEYMHKFGAISYGPNEINGLGTDSYLNIVKATKNARNKFKNFPNEIVVIQNLDIDDRLILVDNLNKIYEWYGSSYKEIYESFYEFLIKDIFIY